MISQYLAETLFEWICILLHVRSHAKHVSPLVLELLLLKKVMPLFSKPTPNRIQLCAMDLFRTHCINYFLRQVLDSLISRVMVG